MTVGFENRSAEGAGNHPSARSSGGHDSHLITKVIRVRTLTQSINAYTEGSFNLQKVQTPGSPNLHDDQRA